MTDDQKCVQKEEADVSPVSATAPATTPGGICLPLFGRRERGGVAAAPGGPDAAFAAVAAAAAAVAGRVGG